MGSDSRLTEDLFFADMSRDTPSTPEGSLERMRFLQRRVLEKIDDYEEYQFSKIQSRALNIFFDLAQEYTGKFDLWALCVVIPKVFFNKNATIYMLGPENTLEWRCCSEFGTAREKQEKHPIPPSTEKPLLQDGHFYIPIKGNHDLVAQLPFKPKGDVIGLMDISPAEDVTGQLRLFFEKYTNRIGYRIHGRLISLKNREHLQFIHSLVKDIGHNVIVPNMYFKLYYKRLESKIRVLRDISGQFSEFTNGCSIDDRSKADMCDKLQREMDYTFDALMEQYNEIYHHYEQTSLFLETLLRRSHFEQGRYVLEMRPCKVMGQVVGPQIERYRPRMEDRGIDLFHGATPDEEATINADIGLISQVFANFVSNAIKYAQPTDASENKLTVGYEVEIVESMPESDKRGVKVSVISSGEHIPEDERPQLYSDGFRGRNANAEYGTGHGLSFIREVVTLHGGVAGYETDPAGNRFYFIMPLVSEQDEE